MTHEMGPIAVERTFELELPDGKKRALKFQVDVPRPVNGEGDDEDWFCYFRAEGLDCKIRRVFGIDSLQAMILAIQLMQSTLKNEAAELGKVTFLGGEDVGLPFVDL